MNGNVFVYLPCFNIIDYKNDRVDVVAQQAKLLSAKTDAVLWGVKQWMQDLSPLPCNST